jgi:8-oxo-dGTP diphosphatase
MKPGIDYIGVGVGAFIFNDKGNFLMMKRGPKAKNEVGAWMLPGGAVEFGETQKNAIIREVREELGVEIEIEKQLPCWDHILPNEKQHWVTNVFSARIIHGEPKILEPEKCEELKWFSLNALPSPIAKASEGAIRYFIS